jgi:hypothetical protein
VFTKELLDKVPEVFSSRRGYHRRGRELCMLTRRNGGMQSSSLFVLCQPNDAVPSMYTVTKHSIMRMNVAAPKKT